MKSLTATIITKVYKNMSKHKLKVIDLFCGAGGLSLGFKQAGFDVILGIDAWEDAIITYKHNIGADVICEDITKLTPLDALKEHNIDPKEIDVIIGGPPCQGFSLSGKRLYDDPRNKLYKAFVEMVKAVRPAIFLMENVPGLVRLFDGKVHTEVIRDFSDLGYTVTDKILAAKNYGVPQDRRRVFFVGINRSKIHNIDQFIFPPETNTERKGNLLTCKDAISDLDFLPVDKVLDDTQPYQLPPLNNYQTLMRSDSEACFNHSITLHTEKTRRIISMVPDGGNYKCLPEELWSTRKVHIAWTRMNSSKPCFTIDCGHNHQFHYKENRVPTVRESARIQSFPDTFIFLGKRTSQYRQVGNAVPPLLAQALATQIKQILENENV